MTKFLIKILWLLYVFGKIIIMYLKGITWCVLWHLFLRFGAAVFVRDEFIVEAFANSKKDAKRSVAEQALYRLMANDEVTWQQKTCKPVLSTVEVAFRPSILGIYNIHMWLKLADLKFILPVTTWKNFKCQLHVDSYFDFIECVFHYTCSMLKNKT